MFSDYKEYYELMTKSRTLVNNSPSTGMFIFAATFSGFWFSLGAIAIFFMGYYNNLQYFLSVYGGYLILSLLISAISNMRSKKGIFSNFKFFLFAGVGYHFVILIMMIFYKLTGR